LRLRSGPSQRQGIFPDMDAENLESAVNICVANALRLYDPTHVSARTGTRSKPFSWILYYCRMNISRYLRSDLRERTRSTKTLREADGCWMNTR